MDPPSDADIQQLVERTAVRVVRLLQRRGLLDPEAPDPLAQDQPLLATLTGASIQGRLAALVPPPRLHLLRYHGVLAPHGADRA